MHSPAPCLCSRSRAAKLRSARAHTRSSCTARLSRAATSRRWCAWPTAQRRASPPRLWCGLQRRAWPQSWSTAWRERDAAAMQDFNGVQRARKQKRRRYECARVLDACGKHGAQLCVPLLDRARGGHEMKSESLYIVHFLLKVPNPDASTRNPRHYTGGSMLVAAATDAAELSPPATALSSTPAARLRNTFSMNASPAL